MPIELEKLHAKIMTCTNCVLSETRENVVPGSGNLDADIMFVGEAPGAKEDKLGIPFVGAAGKFLDEMLGAINLKREDVFITNIVKCRPPGNRDPEDKEKEMCSLYLDLQMELMKPKLIITLGRHAMNYFLPELRISEAHGNLKRKDNQVFLPLYHPAAALYNGSLRKTLLKDFKLIPKILETIDEF